MATTESGVGIGIVQDVQMAPFRPFDDFLLDKARFELPSFKDLQKWNNRMVGNLLYYQTNYLSIILVIFVLIGIIHPKDMVLGAIAIIVGIAVILYALSRQPDAVRFKKEHPLITLSAIVLSGYFFIYVLASVVVFLYSIALPMLLVCLHASLRLRNFKSKANQLREDLGVQKTIMGKLLQLLGIDAEMAIKFGQQQ